MKRICFVLIIFVLFVLGCSKKETLSGQGGFESPTQNTESDILTAELNATESADPNQEEFPELVYSIYKVKKGDMIGFIADEFNLTQDTITSVNRIKNTRKVQIGQYLKIPSMPGILYTTKKDDETIESIVEKYKQDNVSAIKCAAVNSIDASEKLPAGSIIFVPDAELDWVTRQEINGDLFSRPLKTRYYFSSYFGWRKSPFSGKRTYHNGIDMAASHGSKVYAALNGVVTTAGYNNVYGNHIIISHHSGYKTLYAHLSRIDVKVKQQVSQGTLIGRVGSTGLSTGDHLHFSVFKNGSAVNPSNLWR